MKSAPASLIARTSSPKRAKSDNGDGVSAQLLERAQLGKHRCHTESAAYNNDLALFFDRALEAQGTDKIEEGVSLLQFLHLKSRFSNGLDDNGDGSLLGIEIGDGERDTLAGFIDTDHDEMAGLRGPGHVGRFDFLEKCDV